MSSLFLVLACITLVAAVDPTPADIARAATMIPRAEYRGASSLSDANRVLNDHLKATKGLATRPCESMSVHQIQEAQRIMYGAAHPALLAIYKKAEDNRALTHQSLQQMELAWATVAKMVEGRADLEAKHRDGHCHEAVMWYVHHLVEDTQKELSTAGLVLPLLPEHVHTTAASNLDAAAAAVDKSYGSQITCQKCHVGGIDNLGVSEVKPTTQKQLSRRCYTNYKDLFNITCKPCDGIAGSYWGDDDDKYFTPDPCSVVSQPEDVAESDRVQPVFPPQFSVDVVAGSDRWGRTTNPTGHVKTPFPPIIDSMYGQISGKWFVDITGDSDLWMLRHDTHYAHVSFNGTHLPLASFDVSEIHSQTKAQQAINNTGPMVSLIHGLPDFLPGGCTCVADPVGVPDVHHERTPGLIPESGMEYMGRINLTLSEYDGSSIVVDHWANWFFHVFMDVDKSVPHYGKAPARLASAYAGTATYKNWDLRDPTIPDPTVWKRGIPESPERVGPDHGKYCMNPQKIAMCNNISQSTFPPAPEAAHVVEAKQWEALHRSFMPAFDKVQVALTKAMQGH